MFKFNWPFIFTILCDVLFVFAVLLIKLSFLTEINCDPLFTITDRIYVINCDGTVLLFDKDGVCAHQAVA